MSFPAALVREERLELSRLTAQASKTCVSAIPPFPLERPLPQPIGESLWVAMHNSEDEIETRFLQEAEYMGLVGEICAVRPSKGHRCGRLSGRICRVEFECLQTRVLRRRAKA